ncbi:MAG TPA: beta-ketoacyl-[acyl-carrier-protein] synthase family protein [Thermoanaerobaculia bacterium]|nr:beta-ketoacyl-[acyl-carrier-protein] synthase family protein [Thermoanaerobaculia bacterium]
MASGERPAGGRRVVVSGMGVVCAIATDVPSFRQALLEGKDGIADIAAFPTDSFRSVRAGEVKTPLDASLFERQGRKPLDRASLLALTAAREAYLGSGLQPTDSERLQIGIAMGSCGGGYLNGLVYWGDHARSGHGRGNLLLDLPLHAAASRMACEFSLHGGIQVVSNACASSAIALAAAYDRIRSGLSVAMLAGGYDALSPLNCAGFGVMRNSSPTHCIRPFDRERDGMLLGEGAAILILEEREHCLARGGEIWAEIEGCGVTSDTYHLTAPDPSGRGAAIAMEQALAQGGVGLDEVDYINAHGTGTLYNDRMETQAVKRVFGERAYRIPMSSTKSMIGHTLGTAGAVELVASILGLRGSFLPPTIHYENLDPKCDLDCVPNRAREATIRHLISNSFGFGGTNCSLLVGPG